MNHWVLLSVLFAAVALVSGEVRRSSCKINADKTYQVVDVINKEFDAWAWFDDRTNTEGWTYLQVETNPSSVDANAAKCAGIAEGILTAQRLWEHNKLFKISTLEDLNATVDYPQDFKNWMQPYITYYRTAGTSDYWIQIGLIRDQMDGILEGANSVLSEEKKVSDFDFWMVNAAGDMDDLAIIYNKQKNPEYEPTDAWRDVHHHCSGMTKLLPDFSDCFISQTTWSGYTTMHRILKTYKMNFHRVPVKEITMSSYPGQLVSNDDFYITSAKLVVTETTFHIWNTTLYTEYCKKDRLLYWPRMVYALRNSQNGPEWIKNFKYENGFTYNNEYTILDFKLFTPKQQPPAGFAWIYEQVPGNDEERDSTSELLGNMYLPSINTPRWISTYTAAGYPQKVKTDGDYWSYNNSARFHIMQDTNPSIHTYGDFKVFMRYNDYKRDPRSHNDPGQTILSRYELRDPDGVRQPNCFGGLDAKTTNFKLAQKMTFDAILSPNYETQPVFTFDHPVCKEKEHDGLPTEWKFPWIVFGPDFFPEN